MNQKGKKPSERINEIQKKTYTGDNYPDNWILAILDYLDEQHSLNAEKEETHTVKEEECICSVDGIAVNCPVHYKNSQPTTPEKKCTCEKVSEDTIKTNPNCHIHQRESRPIPYEDGMPVMNKAGLGESEKKECKYCRTDYQDPKYCSVFGRTADEHKWL